MVGRRPSVSEPSAVPTIPVPQQTKDPVWSLQPWPVVLTLHGRDYEIPAAPASHWLSVLMVEQPDLDDIVYTMVTDGVELLFDESVGEELHTAVLELITTVSGRPWWIAMRLISVALENWNVVGAEMLYRGVNAEQMSLSGWLDVLLLVTLRSMDRDKVTMFLLRLEQPPVTVVETEQVQLPDMDRNAFLALGQ